MGYKMHSTMKKEYASEFEGLLKEGSVYVISKFGVASNNTQFKMVDHEYKINFNRNTKVVESPGVFRGSLYGFSFVTYESVLDGDTNENLALDFIGALRSCGEVAIKMVNRGNLSILFVRCGIATIIYTKICSTCLA